MLLAVSGCEQGGEFARAEVLGADLVGLRGLVVLSGGRVIAVGSDRDPMATGADLQAFSVDGEIYPSFGDAGLARLSVGVEAAHAHPDGGLVVGGHTATGALVIQKLRHDGLPDSSFGEDGVVHTSGFIIRALAVRPDGGVVVLLWTDGGNSFALLALDPSGRSDQTFGRGGRVDGVIGDAEGVEATDLVLERDGSLLVALGLRNPNLELPVVVRYLPDGRPAPTTGAFDAGINGAAAEQVALGPDGRILVALSRGIVEDGDFLRAEYYLVRFLRDGSRDATFGQDGLVVLPVRPTEIAVDSSGNVYLVGSIQEEQSHDVPFVMRYRSDGQPDGEFGPQGIQRVAVDEEGELRAVVLLDESQPGALFAGGVRFDEIQPHEHPQDPAHRNRDPTNSFLVRLPQALSHKPGG